MLIPYLVSAKDWFSSLLIDFPSENISVPQNDEDWKSSADFLCQSPLFSFNSVPAPQNYDKFEDWANVVYFLMN